MYQQRMVLTGLIGVLIMAAFLGQALATEKTSTNDPALKRWFEKFPAADADGDGIMTETEAKAFKKKKKDKGVAVEKSNAVAIPPSYADVLYGPHERNRLDVWQAAADRPAPVLIYYHGGSFKAGDKKNILTRPVFGGCLEAGISVVSVNYRFSSDAPFPAPMLDGARAVQFVRSKAREWNINPDKVALSGSSAGGTMALWIALHDDLMNAESTDPITRFSTRVSCVVGYGAPASMQPEYILQHAGSKNIGGGIVQLFGLDSKEALAIPHVRKLIENASPISHLSTDDPPLWLTYHGKPEEAPFPAEASQKVWIHHICMGVPLKKAYDDLGLECRVYHQGVPAPAGSEIEFLRKQLCPDIGNRNRKYSNGWKSGGVDP